MLLRHDEHGMSAGDFVNLLEGVERQNLDRGRLRLLKQIATGQLSMPLGTLRESLGPEFWPKLTLDALHKRAVKGFTSIPGANDWRKIVSTVNANDFRLQRAIKTGGYASLDKVPAGGGYKSKKFKDEEENWKLQKYGNTEMWNLEASANDELGRLGAWVQRLGTAGTRTLLAFVFKDLLDDNPILVSDGTALFTAGHNNLRTSAPLTLANLELAWALMRKQTGLGAEKLNLMPMNLIVHTDQEVLANRLVKSALVVSGNTTPDVNANFFEGRLQVIAQPYTTTGRWYLAADPSQIDLLEVGFFRGRQMPETFMLDQGSDLEFSNDSTAVKVRFIFGGTPIDFRGFVRNEP